MSTNYARMPGPGDDATWPDYAGHPNDPRGEEDEAMTMDEAREQATEDLLCEPYMFHEWLKLHVYSGTGLAPLPEDICRTFDTDSLTVPQLIVGIMDTDKRIRERCGWTLRNRFLAESREYITDCARGILESQ